MRVCFAELRVRGCRWPEDDAEAARRQKEAAKLHQRSLFADLTPALVIRSNCLVEIKQQLCRNHFICVSCHAVCTMALYSNRATAEERSHCTNTIKVEMLKKKHTRPPIFTKLDHIVSCFSIFHERSRNRQALFPRPRGACSEAATKSGGEYCF